MKTLKALLALSIALNGVAFTQAPRKLGPAPTAKQKGSGGIFGAIDLGSSGVKSALYTVSDGPDGPIQTLAFNQTIDTKLVSSMTNGRFTPTGIQEATAAVKTEVDAMKAQSSRRGISVDIFFVVGSSGVALAKNKDELAASVKDATGIDLDFIDAAHESYFGMMASVPKQRRLDAMYIDIGSGNAKLGCLVGGTDIQNYHSEEIPFGSKSGANEALKRSPDDVVAGIALVMHDVSASYNRASMDAPCLRNRHFTYWTGGAAWGTTTFTHPEASERTFVPLTRRDLDGFIASLKDNSWNQKPPVFVFPPTLPADRRAEAKAQALADRADVQNKFVREQLLSGASIMRTVLESSNATSFVQFVRSGNYIYGYSEERYKMMEGHVVEGPAFYKKSENLPPSPPPPPTAPIIRTLTVLSGTSLPVRINQTLNSGTTTEGTTFTGVLTAPVMVDGETAFATGSIVNGRVVSVHDATHFSGNSMLSVELIGVNRSGEPTSITTAPYVLQGKGRGKSTAVKTGVGAAGGAILGGILGGGKGAAIGAAAGGGVGAGSNAVTKGEQVQITSEQLITFQLSTSVTVKSLGTAGQNDAQRPALRSH